MSRAAGKAITVAVMLLFPALFLGLVWSLCSAQADGIDVDWAFTRWLLILLGILSYFVVFIFASVLFSISNEEKDEQDTEPEPEPEVATTILVVAIPEKAPARRESIAPQLVAATLAGVAGGLLAHFVMRRRDRQQ